MIGTFDFGEDGGLFEFWKEGSRDKEVIESPANIAFSGFGSVGPPGVVVGFVGVLVAESVNETSFEEFGEIVTFLIGETSGIAVGVGVSEVDFSMGDIEITASNDRLLFSESLEVGVEMGIPFFVAVGKAFKNSLGVGDVGIDEEEGGVFEGNGAAFLRVFMGGREVELTLEGFLFGENNSTGIAFFFGAMEALERVLRKVKFRKWRLREFGFLEAEKVGRTF